MRGAQAAAGREDPTGGVAAQRREPAVTGAAGAGSGVVWAIPGVTGWEPGAEAGQAEGPPGRATAPSPSRPRTHRDRAAAAAAARDEADVSGSIRTWARLARREVAALSPARPGAQAAVAVAADLAALADLTQALQVVYLQTLAVADAEDATAVAGLGATPAMLRDVCGVPIRQAHADVHLARRLFTTPQEAGGLPHLGAAVAASLDPAAVPRPGRPVVTVEQARIVHKAARRMSHPSAAMVCDTLLTVAERLSVDTLAVVARQARQAGLDADQADPRPDPGADQESDPAVDLADDPSAGDELADQWERRNAELRDQRSATLSRTVDGWGVLNAFLPPEDVAAWEAVLDSMAAPRPAASGERDPRSATQRRADALGDAARLLLASGDLKRRAGAAPHVLITVDFADLVAAAGHAAVRACVAATTGGGSPAYAATVRRRLGLVPTGMVDLTVLVGNRWVAVRHADDRHHPGGRPGSLQAGRAALLRLLGAAGLAPPGEQTAPERSAGEPGGKATGPPAARGAADQGPGRGHDPTCSMEITHIDALTDPRPPAADDPLLGPEALAAALDQADPALVFALLRSVSPALGGASLDVLAMGRSARTATPTQVLAQTVRDRGCTVPGCTTPARWCDSDHVVPWMAGGRTDLSNLALRCRPHHREKTALENRLRRLRPTA